MTTVVTQMDAKRYLVVKGVAGLGNRLFTLGSAIDYEQKSERTLLLDWRDGQIYPKGENFFPIFFSLNRVNCASGWKDVPSFEPKECLPPLPQYIFIENMYENFDPVASSLGRRLTRYFHLKGRLARLRRSWKYKGSVLKRGLGASVLASQHITYGSDLSIRAKENLVVFADYCPAFPQSILKAHLKLQPEMETEVNSFCQEHFNGQVVFGLHYRNTDKRPTAQLAEWIRKIKDWEVKPDILFLATDDQNAERLLASHFPQVLTYPKIFPATIGQNLHHYGLKSGDGEFAAQAMKASVMDMFILSRCDYLFFQENSTFSKVSAIYHHDPSKCFDWQTFRISARVSE